ncbi:MAG: family N-acetyltransferase [Cohnella sp.]|nr:family N-acetyltransferase [Cohnella sp.]
MAEIRQLTADRFDERIALSEYAFQYEMSPAQKDEARAVFRPEWTYGLFGEDDRLLSALTILPFEVWVQGRKFAAGGIGGVASWPDTRRQGGVTRLLRHSLQTMRNNGQSFSTLHPFSFAFYRKYGYEMMPERKQYTIDSRWFPPRREVNGSVRLVEKKRELFAPMYEKFASQYNGPLVRDPEWWERKVFSKPGKAAVYYDREGQAEGYLLYQVADRIIKVHEWVALTGEASAGIWNFVGNHDSMADQLTVTMPEDDPLPFLLPEPRLKQEVNAYFMSRIVDVEAFIGQYPFSPSDRADELRLRIEDAHAPWNEGDFILRIEAGGEACLERVPSGSVDDSGGLALNIATLTALLAGGRRPGFLYRIGRLQGSAEPIDVLERRVLGQVGYLADFF